MKKGFTLIELIMVITLLGLISLIVIPTVYQVVNSSKDGVYDEQIKLIENSARQYMADPERNMKLPTNYCYIGIDQLKSTGYLPNKDIFDPKTKTPMVGSVKVSYNGKKYIYEYDDNAGTPKCV